MTIFIVRLPTHDIYSEKSVTKYTHIIYVSPPKHWATHGNETAHSTLFYRIAKKKIMYKYEHNDI